MTSTWYWDSYLIAREISAVEDKGELTVSAVIESDIQVAEAPTAEEKLAGDVVQYLDG